MTSETTLNSSVSTYPRVEFHPGRTKGDATELGYYICPTCRKANYIAAGNNDQPSTNRDTCSWCGTDVMYKGEEPETEHHTESHRSVRLDKLLGRKVKVLFKNGKETRGILGFAETFSKAHDFRKPNCYYIGDISFRKSHVKKAFAIL